MDFVKMFAVLFFSLNFIIAYGVKLSVSQHKILGEPGSLTITCTVDETDVDSVLLIQMKIMYENNFVSLGFVKPGKNISSTIPSALQDRMRIEGRIDQITPANSNITLTIDKEKVECSDGTTYECSLTYFTNNPDNPDSTKTFANGTLEVYDYPSVILLESRVNGLLVEGTSAENKTVIEVGDVLQLQCLANVGGIPETRIQWRKTSDLSVEEQWIDYQPPNGSEVQSTATMHGCGYFRNATVVYNTSLADRNLGFECLVRVSEPPYNSSETQNNPRFYAAFDICTQYFMVAYGKVSYTGVANGSVATLTCDAGYIRNGPENTTCIPPDWIPALGTCESQQETSQTTISFPRTSVESVSDGTTKSTSTAMCPYGSYSIVVPGGSSGSWTYCSCRKPQTGGNFDIRICAANNQYFGEITYPDTTHSKYMYKTLE